MAKRTKKSQSQMVEEIKEAADKAAKGTKTAKRAETVKAPKKAKEAAEQQAATAKPASGDNAYDKALFLHHLPKIAEGKTKIAEATNALRLLYKTAKADGFVKADFEDAFQMQGEEGEKKKKAAIARSLKIAQWLGYDLGAQLDMFMQDERVPAEDRAYAEGESDSMQGKSPNHGYHPATPQAQAYLRGYQDHQAKLGGQFKKLDDATGYGAEMEPGTPAKPSNVVAMSRDELKKQQAESQQTH